MNPPKITVSIIAGITGKDRAIGSGGKLLVHISDDLKRFKALTTGHAIIMGRKTYESIGRILPNRENFIVTRNPDFSVPSAMICTSLEEALEKAKIYELQTSNNTKEIFLIGGSEIYRQGLPFTDKLYLTITDSNLSGDVFFPDYSDFKKVVFKEERFDEKNNLQYSWVDLVRDK